MGLRYGFYITYLVKREAYFVIIPHFYEIRLTNDASRLNRHSHSDAFYARPMNLK